MTNNLNTLLIQIGIPSTEYQTIEDRTTATSSIIKYLEMKSILIMIELYI